MSKLIPLLLKKERHFSNSIGVKYEESCNGDHIFVSKVDESVMDVERESMVSIVR